MDAPAYNIAISRRIFLQIVTFTGAVNSQSPTGVRVAATVRFIEANCQGFLNSRGYSDGLLWRGGDPPGLTLPPPDLLDESVYGERGSRFFRMFDQQGSSGLRINEAHIGTGSREIALAWGTPVTIWPLGSVFHFAYWPRCTFIYDKETPLDMDATVARCGYLGNSNLGTALEDGCEVIFEAPKGFLVVGERDSYQVARLLNPISNTR